MMIASELLKSSSVGLSTLCISALLCESVNSGGFLIFRQRRARVGLEMKKHIFIILVVSVAIAALAVATPYFIRWSLKRAFKPALEESDGIEKVADALEASIGRTLARGDFRLQPGEGKSEGVLSYYQKDPQALQRDKKYYETWISALAIADASGKLERHPGRWESSASAAWVDPSRRTDAWGHAFCIRPDQRQTIILSPGPEALSSIDCNTLKIREADLARMPRTRLNPLASGALIMVVRR
jgi:hypothetical protein